MRWATVLLVAVFVTVAVFLGPHLYEDWPMTWIVLRFVGLALMAVILVREANRRRRVRTEQGPSS